MELDRLIDIVRQELSGERALANVAEIIRYHRIQASPGYRQAAERVAELWRQGGVAAEIVSYPADGRTANWADVPPREWDIEEASLSVVSPANRAGRLCSFAENALCVIQRSAATPPQGVEADLVVVSDGEDESSYAGLDVRGKFVLTQGNAMRVHRLAVEKHGAAGIILDSMNEFPPVRERLDVPDAVQYTSYWWGRGDQPGFGFVLSPRQGEHLRRLVKESALRGEGPVRLRAVVKSRFYDGAIENVTATIPGETAEEVLVVAHLCHPRPSANDNASGAGAVVEAARALRQLIDAGTLPAPRRTIRFILVPEMTGTYAYLANDSGAAARTVAAINLDMVGERQDLCGGTLTLERPPRAMATFAGDLGAVILGRLASQGAKNLAGTASYGLFRHAVTPFSGGSDHYILSDPTVGVGCPMVIQWPDRFYHTSLDTIDKVDPQMLAVAGTLAAAYAYYVATAGLPEAVHLAGEMAAMFAAEVHAAVVVSPASPAAGAAVAPPAAPASPDGGPGDVGSLGRADLTRRLDFLLERKLADVESLRRLVHPSERAVLERVLERVKSDMRATLAMALARREVMAGVLEAAAAAASTAAAGSSVVSAAAGASVAGSASVADAAGALPVSTGSHGAAGQPATSSTGAGDGMSNLVPVRLVPGPVEPSTVLRQSTPEARDAWFEFQKQHREFGRVAVLGLYWADGHRTIAEINDLVALEAGKSDLEYLTGVFRVLADSGVVRLEPKPA